MESSTATPPGQDEKRLAELGYKQTLNRAWSGFSNFAISFTIISILAGCFTTYGQAWNNGGPIAISWGWPLISIPILIIGFCMSELVSAYPTAGGIYWWAGRLGGPVWAWFTGWFNLIGLVAVVASVDYACATFLNVVLGLYEVNIFGINFGDEAHILERGLPALRADPHRPHDRQRPPNPPALAGQQRLGLVARGRRRRDRPGPDLRPRHPPELQLRLRPPDQQQRLQRQHVLVLRPAARLPADPVHDHRLRRLGAHLRGDPRRGSNRRRRESGGRSSTRR